MDKKNNNKLNGRFYTPIFIVQNILNLVQYNDNILKKHIMENSCGDGSFLVEIVNRYCINFMKYSNDLSELKGQLEEYIHAIEIDETECNKAIDNVNKVALHYGLNNVKWDIHCENTLEVERYNNKMDFVVGNPPYIRVHNLGDNFDVIKKYKYAQSGMTDMYLVFYEIGIAMLNNTGKLIYITPSSLYNSVAGKVFRKDVIEKKLLTNVVNLQHFQPFDATTYTTILLLSRENTKEEITYYEYDKQPKKPIFCDNLAYQDFTIGENYYFGKKEELNELKKIYECQNKEIFQVKNGFATLCDKVFINDYPFDDFAIKVVKASTGEWKSCFFPYKNGAIIDEDTIVQKKDVYNYLLKNKTTLENRSLEKNSKWYAFGRSQGINDVYKNKIAINALLRGVNDIKICHCESGTGVYSGLYILTDLDFEVVKHIILSEDFIEYVKLLGKYKSGGYYTYSSKDLLLYLNYKYKEKDERNEQYRFF